MKRIIFMIMVVLGIALTGVMTACSSDDNTTNNTSPMTKALVGEWIIESEVDDITSTTIFHFNDNGTCWKEVDILEDGEFIQQPVDRNSTEGTYSVDASGKVSVDYDDSEEGDELRFDGAKLTYEYGGDEYYMTRATDEQIMSYKEQSDAWHGGSDEPKLNVDDYKPKAVDNSEWMKALANDRLVANLSLPGSHDACTAEGWNNPFLAFAFEMTAKCQDLTINEQLKAGVRVFDLRPEHDLDGKNYVLRCCHGPAGTKMYVADFLKTLKAFLNAHPTEFCIITAELSATNNKTAWGKDFNALVNSQELKSMFADFKARLTVGEMRGKVLLLSKEVYAEKPLGGYCYGWVNDLELEKQQKGHITAADGSETPLWVQDYWKNIIRENKDAALLRMLDAAAARDMNADKPAWVINYPSAYIDGPFSDNYRKNAESTNQKTIDWLSTHTASVGIIYMDFAGMNESPDYTKTKLYKTVGMKLIDALIKQNSK